MRHIIIVFFFLTSLYSEPITPIPQSIKVDQNKVNLGHELFFDTMLSKNNTISCASCHDLDNGGDDGLRYSFGIGGQEGDINSPTVYNTVFNFRQFWNGRAKDLHAQAQGPVENPIEMGNDFSTLIKTLNATPYKLKFHKIYEDGITQNNIADAIAEYEKTLITPNSRFDKYLLGDKLAITKNEKNGYELFKSKGCIACHHGVNVGGNLYNKFGVMQSVDSRRLGRYEVTRNDNDKYYFKVPTLRNIEHTAPYLHDGRYDNLEDVVKFMARYQLGKVIKKSEIDDIVSFLRTLSGEIPKMQKDR